MGFQILVLSTFLWSFPLIFYQWSSHSSFGPLIPRDLRFVSIEVPPLSLVIVSNGCLFVLLIFVLFYMCLLNSE